MQPTAHQGEVTTNDILLHLWNRRWLMIVLPPIAVVLGYLLIRTFGGETFESRAILMVRTPTSNLREGPRLDELDPPVYEDLLLNDEILYDVIVAAREKFEDFPKENFERIKKSFKVKSIMTRDTSVQATFSPVIIMTAQAGTRETTFFIMNEWLKRSLERFGELRFKEATSIQTAALEKYDLFAAESAKVETKIAALELRDQDLRNLSEAKNRVLMGTRATGSNASVDIRMENAQAQGSGHLASFGLIAEHARLELERAGFSTKESPDAKAKVAELDAKMVKVAELYNRTTEEIQALNEERAKTSVELDELRRQLISARERMGQMRTVVTTTTADAALVADPFNADVRGGDLLLLARPVMPENRVAPARTVIAIGIAAFLEALLLMIIICEAYFRRAVLGRS